MSIRFTILSLLALVCGSGSAWAENYALIVGVNACPQYRLPGGASPRPLRGAEHDADAMAALLIDLFKFKADNVRVLKATKATHPEVEALFKAYADKLTPTDQFVFYFSGHGTQTPDQRPFEEQDRLDECLCLSDAQADGKNLLRDDELAVWLEAIRAQKITVVLDSCHSGTGVKGDDDEYTSRSLPMLANGVSRRESDQSDWSEFESSSKSLGRSMAALFACQANQQAYERRWLEFQPPRRMGQFTYYFTQGLRGKSADLDGDGAITYQEVMEYVRKKIDRSFNEGREGRERQAPFVDVNSVKSQLFR